MSTHRVSYRDWEFEADVELTRQTYSKRANGGSEDCPCGYCKNYRQQKEAAFPGEIIELFQMLGIDSGKECEIYTFDKLTNGLQDYSGWFHFAGRIISGDNCKKRIDDNFQIGFTRGNDLSFFEDGIELVQVEFETNLPWIIEESERQ